MGPVYDRVRMLPSLQGEVELGALSSTVDSQSAGVMSKGVGDSRVIQVLGV